MSMDANADEFLCRDEVLGWLETLEQGAKTDEVIVEDIMRGIFKGSDTVNKDKFVTRAQQLKSARQLVLMGGQELTLQ